MRALIRGTFWGRREYDLATAGVRATGRLGALKTIIGVLCLSMVALGIIVQLHPLGPHGLVPRLIHGVVVASAAVVGLHWMMRPWPTHRGAVVFVAWADLAIGLCAALTTASPAQLNATTHMGLIGVFIAFMLGWRVLVVHSAFAAAVIVGLTVWGVVGEHSTVLDLYIYYAPALSTVVLLPVIIQVVIEAGRRSIGRTARHALHDPLTGLYNRRGMNVTVQAALASPVATKVLAAAVIDLDKFKDLNDTHGHHAGDVALREVTHRMRGMVRHDRDLVARTGGDEFVLIAHLEGQLGLDSFIDRCVELHDQTLSVGTSIGVAWQTVSDPHFSFDALLHRADTAMYASKRAGGRRLSVYNESHGA